MQLEQWLIYLENLRSQQPLALSLERVTEVAERLQLLSLEKTIITVAGTNGKGSCVALLEQILLAANHKIGVYTSPHLLRYNERIRINGIEIDDYSLCKAFSNVENARQNIFLTYFEFSTLAALLLFKEANLDVLLLEVGLGGRLDAVNIISPTVAIISSIALDHTSWLGHTRELIGKEKAGILRNNVPAVSGDFLTPQSIRDCAVEIGSKLFCQNENFGFTDNNDTWDYWSEQENLNYLPIPKIALQNAATVLKALELLPPAINVSHKNIKEGLQKVFVPGRLQIFLHPVEQIFDVAHNPAAAQLLAQQLKQLPHKGKTLAVLGILNDKDHVHIIEPLLSIVDQWFTGGLATERSSSGEELAELIRSLGASQILAATTIVEAYYHALSQANSNDRLVIFGSFYTVAEILKIRL